MEKPKSVEVGSRWASKTNSAWGTATVVAIEDTGEFPITLKWDGLDGKEAYWARDSVLQGLAYLGPSLPKQEPGKPAPAKGQRWRDTQRYYHDGKPFTVTEKTEVGWRDDGDIGSPWLFAAFTNGRLAFVDHGTPESPPPAPPPEALAPKSALSTRPASCLAERWDETGPLSALTSIQARRSSDDLKPKEPWVPSCDIDCDIPDAGTSWSRNLRHPKAGGGR